MVNFHAWLSGPIETVNYEAMASRAWLLIQRDPVEITFTVPRVVTDDEVIDEHDLDPQTVRIAHDDRAEMVVGTAGSTPEHTAVVYGVMGHATEPDTDIAEGYTFVWDNRTFRVRNVLYNPGEIQAIAVATG